jgi:predicted DNA-binding transcriptional regulator AlpA
MGSDFAQHLRRAARICVFAAPLGHPAKGWTVTETKKIRTPQVAAALKADTKTAALSPALVAANAASIAEAALAPDRSGDPHDRQRAHARHVHLLDKAEVCAIANVTFPTIWSWMRAGKFPRSRMVGGKSMWRSDEIERWLAELPMRPLKGDGEDTGAAR